MNVGLKSSTSLRKDLGSKEGKVATWPPVWRVGSAVTIDAKMWNMGRIQIVRGWYKSVVSSEKFRPLPNMSWHMLLTKLRCVSITPLGSPVVPEENGTMATSSESVLGSSILMLELCPAFTTL